MRARIKCEDYFYYGEVYDEKYKYWKRVTDLCFTELGAKIELKKYKKKNFPEEFEI